MHRRVLLSRFALGAAAGLLGGAVAGPRAARADSLAAKVVTVFRSPTCGCCKAWIEHMEAAGFQIRDNVTDAMAAVKRRYGVPEAMESCHTAVVDGYVIEGHVPAADVRRLLAERPKVRGIAAPGMPVGSPGMEMGDRVDSYRVFSFADGGRAAVFAAH
ncbi:MAG: DUF411 domain-containing protein [Elainellaceae cyanobacterium]